MDTLNQVGVVLGSTGVSLRMELASGVTDSAAGRSDGCALHQGEEVSGLIRVSRMGAPQEIRSLAVALVKFWYERADDGYERTMSQPMVEIQLPGCPPSQEVAPITVPFQLSVPIGIGLTDVDEWWKLRATADVPGPFTVVALESVTVQPPLRVLAMRTQIEAQLGWRCHHSESLGPPAGAVRLSFRPPADLSREFDDLRVNALVRGADLEVAAALELHEKRVLDYLRTVLGREAHEEHFVAASPGDVVSRLRDMIRRHRVGRR